MTENAKNPAAQSTIQDPPEYNAENAKNPKEGSDWLGGPQNGNEQPNGTAPASSLDRIPPWSESAKNPAALSENRSPETTTQEDQGTRGQLKWK